MAEPDAPKAVTREAVRAAKQAGLEARRAKKPNEPPAELGPELQRWWGIGWERADEKRSKRGA